MTTMSGCRRRHQGCRGSSKAGAFFSPCNLSACSMPCLRSHGMSSLLHRGDVRETAEEREERRKRDEIREERRRERERERRLEALDAHGSKRSKITRDRDRDISERIALGQANTGVKSSEALYDQRLFNQDQASFSGSVICSGFVLTLLVANRDWEAVSEQKITTTRTASLFSRTEQTRTCIGFAHLKNPI